MPLSPSVSSPPLEVRHPERRLSLAYAPRDRRAGLAALWALDEALGDVLRGREAALAQLRLAWWREALARLDTAPPPAQPLLVGLAAAVRPHGVPGAALAGLVDGWELLLASDEIGAAELDDYAAARGALFVLGGAVLGSDAAPLAQAGAGFALIDLARAASDPALAEAARAAAAPLLADALAPRWPRRLRPLGMIARAARADLNPAAVPGPGRLWDMVRFGAFGR